MRLIDTHAHLYVEDFDADIDAVVMRAQINGVEKVFLPNINAESIAPMHQLCDRFPTLFYPMMGLHPTDVSANYSEVLDDMERLFTDSHPYIAVGEVGLDYYWDRTFYEEQKLAFSRQIAWAVVHNLPLMIHSRSAHEELVEVLKNTKGGGHTGVFHCFSGSRDEAEELLGFDGYMCKPFSREMIAKTSSELYDKTEDSLKEIKEKAEDVVEDLQKKGDELIAKVQSMLNKKEEA